jgi:hypothetical protein
MQEMNIIFWPGYELVRDGRSVSATIEDKSLLDESVTVDGTGSNTENNEIKLTFSEDDTYDLSFVFDDKPDSEPAATDEKQIDVNAAVSGGDATAIVIAINEAIAKNVTRPVCLASLLPVSQAMW